jgi:hypothetical protein
VSGRSTIERTLLISAAGTTALSSFGSIVWASTHRSFAGGFVPVLTLLLTATLFGLVMAVRSSAAWIVAATLATACGCTGALLLASSRPGAAAATYLAQTALAISLTWAARTDRLGSREPS